MRPGVAKKMLLSQELLFEVQLSHDKHRHR